jgi:hypothetical protein
MDLEGHAPEPVRERLGNVRGEDLLCEPRLVFAGVVSRSDDPPPAAFTITGRPNDASTSSAVAGPTSQSGVGMPASRRRRLVTSLSMASEQPSRSLPV